MTEVINNPAFGVDMELTEEYEGFLRSLARRD